ncbi:fucolectin-7-like [Physella acuta]|uniref:fucolectin-7-like n=1 Tax=Physella acuta TaxID=109671 RepID=UPI0027DC5E4B|nr:fucolectin-7-like [Physella acuta]
MSVVSDSLFNAALYKPAYVSSVYTTISLPASNANDGNDSVSLASCTHTNVDDPGWWMVDLRGLYRVEQIVLVNRGDDNNSSLRTQNYQFDVFRSDPRLSSGFPTDPGEVCYKRIEPVGQGATLTQICDYPIMGRFVRFTRFIFHLHKFRSTPR